MPLLKNSNELPEWSELDYYTIINLTPFDEYIFNKKSFKEVIFLCSGECEIVINNEINNLVQGSIFKVNPEQNEIIFKSKICCTLIIVGGNWGDETGSHGIFTLDSSNSPKNIGDQVDYERTTYFDNHYHDCDEYWIFHEGEGVAVSENKFYNVKAGDCVATKIGDHHDFPIVKKTMRGIWFETTLKGKKRSGHLWNHTHGAPEGEI